MHFLYHLDSFCPMLPPSTKAKFTVHPVHPFEPLGDTPVLPLVHSLQELEVTPNWVQLPEHHLG